MDQMGCAAAAVVALDWWDCFEADGLRHATAGIQALRAEQQAAAKSVLCFICARDGRVPNEPFRTGESFCQIMIHNSLSPLICSWARPPLLQAS